MEEHGPKTHIKKMSDGVISPDIDIGRSPVFYSFLIPSVLFIMRRSVTPEIPRRASITVKGISLTGHFFAIDDNLLPVFSLSKSGTTRAIWFIVSDIWQNYRQLIFWNRVRIPIFIIGNWNWTTPVTLTRNQPVTHTIGGTRGSNLIFFEIRSDFCFGFLRCKTGIVARVN